MLKALIFDFDGLILDTETPEVLVWQSIYREHGFELPAACMFSYLSVRAL